MKVLVGPAGHETHTTEFLEVPFHSGEMNENSLSNLWDYEIAFGNAQVNRALIWRPSNGQGLVHVFPPYHFKGKPRSVRLAQLYQYYQGLGWGSNYVENTPGGTAAALR
jgi:hypothetical protein